MPKTLAGKTCALCSEPLTGCGDDWGTFCASCADVVSNGLDELDLTDEDVPRLLSVVERMVERMRPWGRKLRVPTYYGDATFGIAAPGDLPEFGPPLVPILVERAEGVRLLLGSHDSKDMEKPNVAIERRPHGWAIFLHPVGGEPCGNVYFHDDGRSFLLPEPAMSPPIRAVSSLDEVAEIDRMPRRT